jgi:predicted DNA-binding transcriptional regulator AlpA
MPRSTAAKPPGKPEKSLKTLLAQSAAPLNAEGAASAIAEKVAELVAGKLAEQLRSELLLGDDAVFDEEETAQALKKSRATLEAWRRTGIGPRSIKLGPRAVGYTLGDLREYIKWAARGPLTPDKAIAK